MPLFLKVQGVRCRSDYEHKVKDYPLKLIHVMNISCEIEELGKTKAYASQDQP
jgi:hypothetical protein